VNVENLQQLIQALRNGSDLETACAFAGVSSQEVYRGLERGKFEAEKILAGSEANAEESQNLELWQTLKKARADAIVQNVAFVQKAARNGDWKAAAWWLERAVPEQYGKRTPKQVDETKAVEGK
jgi:hypothetical protein